MSQSSEQVENKGEYENDHRLIQAYHEATQLNEEGLAGLCPSYLELSEISTRYEEQQLLGKGGVKEVFRTFDSRTRRWVAMARPRDDRGPEFNDLFVNEAWLTSSLNHPNIINVHDVGIDSMGRPFFTMDLKGNTTLAELIKTKGQSRRALLQDFLKVCDAVAYAHSREVIHLDLKPENIQCDSFGEVLVCDWGLGKLTSELDEEGPEVGSTDVLDNMTLVGEIKGSPGYMAPEQLESGGLKDHRTDVFSLGCILHAILTGEPPFTGSRQAILEATKNAQVLNPCEKYSSAKVPASLGAVALKALEKNAAERYRSVTELKGEVQRYLDGFSTDAEAPNFLREARLFASRNRTPVLVSFLSLILLTVLSTLFIQRIDNLSAEVSNKSQLAQQYASEAELANELYSETVAESKEQQQILSDSLLSSTKRLKNRGIFDTPMKSIREAKALATYAHALDPDSEVAKYELFALNIIQLNFEEALKYPQKRTSARYSYVRFAESFPEFSYDRYERPSQKELSEFLKKAREIDLEQSPIMERILSYDAALRPSKNSYHEVLQEFLAYLNPKKPMVELGYRSADSSLTLRSEEAPTLISKPGGSQQCVLRYLKFRSLNLEVPEGFNLSQLEGLDISELDLTKCGPIHIEAPLSLPSLRVIRIDSQVHSAEEIRERLSGSRDLRILEGKDEQ